MRTDAARSKGQGAPVGRRVVLGMLGVGAVGVVIGGHVQNVVDQALAPTGLGGLLPGDYFRIYTVTDGFPYESDTAYRLAVDGMVDHPLDLTLADLQSMPATELVKPFQCVTGWRVDGVRWKGVALADLLESAGVSAGASALAFESFDGVYTESLTLDQARRGDVIVAYSMDGAPLSREHGGPARLYVAPMYGYKSIKWLSRITVTDRVEPGYWETEGNYSVNAWIGSSNGRDDPPVD